MPESPFSSMQPLQQVFMAGLSGLLGPFILVCANASFDQRVGNAAGARGYVHE